MVFHIDVLPSACRECFVKGGHCVGQFVLYHVNCYIPAVMGRPKDASGCHCVLLLCHLMYSHLPNISPWRLRRFTKSQSHLIPPILSQLCAHGPFKIIKQLVTEVVLSLTLHQIIPPLHPLSSPPAVSGAPGLRCSQHPRRRPRRGAAPRFAPRRWQFRRWYI